MKKDNRSALTRRDFFKGGAILGAAAVGASILSSCSPQTSGGDTDTDTSNSNDAESTSSSYDYSNLKSKSVAGEASQYDFKHINQPLTLGKYELKNRMIKSCSSGFEFRGSSEVQAEVYRQYAQGGAAMIVYPVMQVMTSAADTASLIPIIEAVHETEGVPFFAQVVGEGSERGGEFDLHAPLGAPIFKVGDTAMMSEGEDAEMMPMMESGPNTMMTTEQVQIKVEAFAQSANFLKAAGFDGIEINAAAEHFFDSFLSRFWNRERTDQYGPQSIENRCRILTEIITRIHELCGEDFPVGVLYNGHECNALYPGDDNLCSTVSETREMAKVFEAAGASHLQIRSVMFGNHTSGFFPDLHFTNGEPDTTYGHFYDIKRYWPEYIAEYGGAGAFLDTAAKIKEVVSIPVFPVAMQDPRLLPDIIDNAIGEGKIDAIAMTRRIYADLEFPNKIVVGDLSNIRPCTNCTHCLQGACRVNPAFGRGLGEEMPEGYTPAPTASPKKILIVGGGPAGLECAHTAAERGHSVTLYEKSSVWGGLTNTAIAIKGT
ncbi:MAG: NAD(P)-binding protein, partial [Coriobacteriales bacterium]|nr:NAD(P)-binding protein [Coriobacteriales bacterium]